MSNMLDCLKKQQQIDVVVLKKQYLLMHKTKLRPQEEPEST